MNKKMYLISNIILAPIKDLEFFDIDLICERMSDVDLGKLDDDKDAFLEAAYKNLNLKCNIKSIDEIKLMFKKYYPYLFHRDANLSKLLSECELGGVNSAKLNRDEIIRKFFINKYIEILKKLSKSLLSIRDGEVVYKYWKTQSDEELFGPFEELDKVHLFCIVTKLIPIDMLTMICLSGIENKEEFNGVYHYINVADAPMNDLLCSGVAENHLHASASYNFTFLWELCMNDFLKAKDMSKFRKSLFASNVSVDKYIAFAKFLRLVLSLYLKDVLNGFENSSINKWLENNFEERNKEVLYKLLKLINEKNQLQEIEKTEIEDLIEFLTKRFNITKNEEHKDYVLGIFDSDEVVTYGEIILNHNILKAINAFRDNGKISEYINLFDVFHKYIAIKCEFHQQVTQSSTVKGLDFFRTYFSRATGNFGYFEYSEYFTKVQIRSILQSKYIKKAEFRFSLSADINTTKKRIRQFLKAYKDILIEDYGCYSETDKYSLKRDFPRIGIIYHLIKREDNIEKCCYLKGQNYFEKIQSNYIKQVREIIKLRNEIPYLSRFVVGLDAASLENNTPVHIFSPVFQEARDMTTERLRINDSFGNQFRPQSLFFTFHAGEDFRHLLSGLRRMDEVVEYCKFHSGDRIGHGTALGLDAQKWLKENPIVIIPRGEYLDNLIWAWSVYSKYSNISSKAFIFLERKILELTKEIYDKFGNITVGTVYDSYTKRFEMISDKHKARKFNKEKSKNDSEDDIKEYSDYMGYCEFESECNEINCNSEFIHSMHNCKHYLEKIVEPIYVNPNGLEFEIILEMQNYLREKIAKKGIVIEVNPSSNQVIGEMDTIFDNQLYKLNLAGDESKKNVMVCVNSDDPLVFNTNAANELSFIYYGMIKSGVGMESALKWIEKIRKTGMDTSFIRSDISDEEYLKSLKLLIEELEDYRYSV